MQIEVCAGWLKDERIGVLIAESGRGRETVSFVYDPRWGQLHNDLFLGPDLILSAYPIYSEKSMFGIFEDCAPDRWGRRLIQDEERLNASKENRNPKHLTETDYILRVQDFSRSGGLRFKLLGHSEWLTAYNDNPIPPITGLRDLAFAAEQYENPETRKTDALLRKLLFPGSSLGGARPKATVRNTDGTLWLAKFPSNHDTYDIGAWEMTMHDLEVLCGIHTPPAMLKKFSDKGSTYIVKRFDRADANSRIMYASAMTMLGMEDGKADSVGYLDLAEKISEISDHALEDKRELFTRTAFNICTSNHDDHLRNHGFLLNANGKWRLSPVFDVNPDPQADSLSLLINLDTNVKNLDLLLEVSDFFDLPKSSAEQIVKKVAAIVDKEWRNIATKYHIPAAEQEQMIPAFSEATRVSRQMTKTIYRKPIHRGSSR